MSASSTMSLDSARPTVVLGWIELMSMAGFVVQMDVGHGVPFYAVGLNGCSVRARPGQRQSQRRMKQ